MEDRLAIIGIIVEDMDRSQEINDILHQFSNYIVGRMGIPYKTRNVSLISVIVDAPQNTVSSLSGKLGRIENVTVSTAYTKAKWPSNE
ncbi:TM1266 family iron-only hydrogenase system putative regulator [Filifactor villosus]|uniref:TM1266 family iron-only hydrogenase system putative regulator n=1 Tax=Filifactor villosus TaxID=29374 RepID=A0ABV9QP89_9FIRM